MARWIKIMRSFRIARFVGIRLLGCWSTQVSILISAISWFSATYFPKSFWLTFGWQILCSVLKTKNGKLRQTPLRKCFAALTVLLHQSSYCLRLSCLSEKTSITHLALSLSFFDSPPKKTIWKCQTAEWGDWGPTSMKLVPIYLCWTNGDGASISTLIGLMQPFTRGTVLLAPRVQLPHSIYGSCDAVSGPSWWLPDWERFSPHRLCNPRRTVRFGPDKNCLNWHRLAQSELPLSHPIRSTIRIENRSWNRLKWMKISLKENEWKLSGTYSQELKGELGFKAEVIICKTAIA